VILQRGFSKEILITTAPPDFKPKPPNPAKGEPFFPNVDNPGNWSEYTFYLGFKKKDKGGQYTFHSLPTGAVLVPVNDDKQEAAGWEFHYKGWKHDKVDDVSFQSGASAENLLPKKQQGCLDAELLTKMGLTEARMVNEDALFFYSFCFRCASLQNLESMGIQDVPTTQKWRDGCRSMQLCLALEGPMGTGSGKFLFQSWFILMQPWLEMAFMVEAMEHFAVAGKGAA
jgi:hypothetical protein